MRKTTLQEEVLVEYTTVYLWAVVSIDGYYPASRRFAPRMLSNPDISGLESSAKKFNAPIVTPW
jgi:hypothetical protein